MMLQGQHNHRIDHLIYTLIRKVVPYFKAKHNHQKHGFEGPNLELKRWKDLHTNTASICLDHILYVDDPMLAGKTYLIRSQSDPAKQYIINMDAFTCDCPSFPLILFCKHLTAVQYHFKEEFTERPYLSILTSSCDTLPATVTLKPSHDVIADGKLGLVLIDELSRKLQCVAICAQLGQLHITPDLQALDELLDRVIEAEASLSILPPKQKIAPNQHSWTETAHSMGVPVNTKKRKITEPFGGGQQSGRKAQPDTRKPLPKQTRYVVLCTRLHSI